MRATRIAAVYDIHGNIDALEVVLQEIEDLGVDQVVIGGDIVWGPFPKECIDRVRSLAATVVRGNADREVAEPVTQGLDEVVADINRWCWERLDEDDRQWLRALPTVAEIETDELGRTLFCHGSPRSDEENLTPATPSERVLSAIGDVEAEIIVCGHTHMQFDRPVGNKRVVNAGSVGLPYEGEAGAFWAIVGPDVELKRSSYDIDRAADRMSSSGCPHVEMVFVDTLRTPPTREDAIRQFET